MAFTVSLCLPKSSRIRLTSSPGSTTSASRVTGSPMIEQLHCNIPTGMVMWISPCFSAPTMGAASLTFCSIASRRKPSAGRLGCALCYTEVCVKTRVMSTTQTQKVIDTPLSAIHQAAGAKPGVWFGCALPDDFGDWQSEYWLAHKSVALIDKSYRAYISFTGPDRVRYLNAILTNNVKDLLPSRGIVSLLLNAQGHILAEIETYASAERLFCISYAMIRERLVETLDKYIIMDDVTLSDETQRYATIALEGPRAVGIVSELTRVDLTSLPEMACLEAQVDAIPCTVTRRSPGKFIGGGFFVV